MKLLSLLAFLLFSQTENAFAFSKVYSCSIHCRELIEHGRYDGKDFYGRLCTGETESRESTRSRASDWVQAGHFRECPSPIQCQLVYTDDPFMYPTNCLVRNY